ncbi:hypothetical protein C4M78_28185, partial [Escherichia coli]|uniref:GFA family protein n=1 Tax=Escherichia coli TaxID=562 RepID=UPI000D4D45A4
KYRTGFCFCESCRRCAGFELHAWTFVPKSNLLWHDGTPFESNKGSQVDYESKPGTTRSFCGTCGALITFFVNDRHAELY